MLNIIPTPLSISFRKTAAMESGLLTHRQHQSTSQRRTALIEKIFGNEP